MKWLDSFTFVMKSSITTLREKIEDPERMLHQLICDMEEELGTVRESVAAAIADEIQLSKQVDKANEAVKLWLERAQAAIQRNDESAAKDALDQKLRCEERVATLRRGTRPSRCRFRSFRRRTGNWKIAFSRPDTSGRCWWHGLLAPNQQTASTMRLIEPVATRPSLSSVGWKSELTARKP